jgi:general secretion pathway protein L
MSEYLVIRLGKNPQQPVHWIAADSSGAQLSAPASGMLAEAAADIGDREVIVLVPSAEVLTTCVDIPVRGGAKLQAALPYALEEYLADDVDKLHFAAGAKRASGKTPVSVASHERVTDWVERLVEANIHASAIVADSYGLARIPGTISMLLAEDQVFINDGGDTELVMEDVSPGDALAAIGALDDGGDAAGDDETDVTPVPRHLLVYCAAEDEERYQHDWIAIRHELEGVDVKLLADGIMPRLAATVATGAGVNLLQGIYGARKEYGGMFRPWKYAAMLLLALVVIGTGAKATDYFLLLREEASLQEMFNTEYRQMLPGAPETEDPARVIESLKRRIGTVSTAPVFLQSMEQLSRAMQQNEEARIEAISYRSGVIDIRVTAPNVGMLVDIQKAVGQNGQFKATIQSTDQDDDKVSSRMQIQEIGS